jgi:putative ABC transport system permease protein
MLAALHRKLFRDLGHLTGQVVTIALVVACGIASFVAMRGSFASLEYARRRVYEHLRFADLFVELERAPESVRARIEALPGVATAESRIVKPMVVLLSDETEPLRGNAVSLPGSVSGGENAEGAINRLRLRDGRLPEFGHPDEAVLLEVFAEARHIRAGDRLPVVLNGKLRRLAIVGIAVSPEYILALSPGAVSTDPGRFPIVWMARDSLAASFQLSGAFNSLVLSLRPSASLAAAIDAVDRELQPWGGLGAIGRDRQPSNQMLQAKLSSLSSMGLLIPTIFLAVAALLVNLVLSRLVIMQQPEIATLKALGYSNQEVGLHFLQFVLVVVGLGIVTGLGLGTWLGEAMIKLYAQYFRLPELGFRLDGRDAVIAVGISFLSACVGAFGSVRRAVRLPPAEAMRPPSPAHYKRSLADRLQLSRLIGPAAQMIVRELERQPMRAVSSALAVAMATALSVTGGFYYDGIGSLYDSQFNQRMREDAAVSFLNPLPERAARELFHLPGVLAAEGLRVVPVSFHAGFRHRDGAVFGYSDDAEMRALRDGQGRLVAPPPEGMLLTGALAHLLGVQVGDQIEIELHEGAHQSLKVAITGLIDEPFGLQGHMRLVTLRRLLDESPHVSMAVLRLDPALRPATEARLKKLPNIVDVTRPKELLQSFRQETGNMILTMSLIIALFAATITIGVVYNNARIALSLRGRDLASLRVLGFTRGEIGAVLIGEQLIQVALALPLGLWLGHKLVQLIVSRVDLETYRLPTLLSVRSYAFAACVTLLAALFSAFLVRRRLDHLDLIGVLKTRE